MAEFSEKLPLELTDLANPSALSPINVRVAYATPQQQIVIELQVLHEITLEQAIIESGILTQLPEIDLTKNKVGIWGKVCALNTRLKDGDRIEIYRPLLFDPKQARRQRTNQVKRK